MANGLLLVYGAEHALHRSLYILYGLVYDLIQMYVHVLRLGYLLCGIVRTYIEAYDYRISSGSKDYIGFVYRSDTAVDDLYGYLIIGKL